MDPPPVPQLEIPVTLSYKVYTDGLPSPEPLIWKTGCLILVAFYFVLRVGKYNKPKTVTQNRKRVSDMRTKTIVFGNVRFFHNGMIMPRKSPLDVLLTSELAVLNISNSEEFLYGPNHNAACNRHHYVPCERLGSHRIRCLSVGRRRSSNRFEIG